MPRSMATVGISPPGWSRNMSARRSRLSCPMTKRRNRPDVRLQGSKGRGHEIHNQRVRSTSGVPHLIQNWNKRAGKCLGIVSPAPSEVHMGS
ncbi:hypothetical protein EMEDMD4_50020 [Sinorhizobium medicae]|uniref:Uncharacterized protein n=1 Tax=Sinorhizobium medicae TaxID=110321 RepID=A0A508X6A4_9HYPH|nr:hypothetical protein EMEDMD4_50020 [Sinorhizobium medicae]